MEWFGAPGSPPIPSPTQHSPYGGAAVILVECGVENNQADRDDTVERPPWHGRLGRMWPPQARRPLNHTFDVEVPGRPTVPRIVTPSVIHEVSPLILEENRMIRGFQELTVLTLVLSFNVARAGVFARSTCGSAQ
jgi:hypothetical protein